MMLPPSAAASARRLLALASCFLHRYPYPAVASSFAPEVKLNAARTMSTHPSLSPVSTPNAPAAVGPYTQAVRVGDLLFLSGSLGLDPATGKMVDGGVEAQAKQALQNMKAIIEAGGSEVGKVVKTTVFLQSMDDFKAVNAVYSEFFGNHKPARSAVQVARLPLDALFEIEAIVSMPYEPADEPALNVIYNFDIDKSADSERLDGGPSRSDSDVAPNESHGYNLRPVRSYSVYRRIQEEEDSHGAWRESTRAARRPTPYMRARVSPGPSTTGYSADRPDPREIRFAFPFQPQVVISSASSTKSNEPGRTTVQNDAVRGEASVDGLRGKEPSVLCISSDSSDGEDEKEDDGVPAEQKSPVRVYKVFRAPSPKPAGRRARGVTEPLRVMKKAHNDRYSHKHKNQLIRPAPRNGQTPQAPHALIEGVRAIREDYPHDDFSAGYTHLRDGQIKWGIRCLSCPNAPVSFVNATAQRSAAAHCGCHELHLLF
ncbi:hypothetical protein BN946_scf184753.g35 [Trametes cinnabarina]|uniref:Uncharacterized protein n=1 Tax=Pycnoporus cinnabarinus TaxID=5643 RepID=A0A060SSG2_PYCCI|nr:hypothetical protein BN946_scf184753.g35 [Trametes cinnabarina]